MGLFESKPLRGFPPDVDVSLGISPELLSQLQGHPSVPIRAKVSEDSVPDVAYSGTHTSVPQARVRRRTMLRCCTGSTLRNSNCCR